MQEDTSSLSDHGGFLEGDHLDAAFVCCKHQGPPGRCPECPPPAFPSFPADSDSVKGPGKRSGPV